MDKPWLRKGTWQPERDNDANLAAMVAKPSHLVHGVGDPDSPAQLSAAAVHRLLTDHVKPLPITDITGIGGSNSGSQGSPQQGTAPPAGAGAGP